MVTTIQKHYPLLLLFLCAFFVRVLLLPFYADLYLYTGTTMRQYELASNIADGNGFVINRDFDRAREPVQPRPTA